MQYLARRRDISSPHVDHLETTDAATSKSRRVRSSLYRTRRCRRFVQPLSGHAQNRHADSVQPALYASTTCASSQTKQTYGITWPTLSTGAAWRSTYAGLALIIYSFPRVLTHIKPLYAVLHRPSKPSSRHTSPNSGAITEAAAIQTIHHTTKSP